MVTPRSALMSVWGAPGRRLARSERLGACKQGAPGGAASGVREWWGEAGNAASPAVLCDVWLPQRCPDTRLRRSAPGRQTAAASEPSRAERTVVPYTIPTPWEAASRGGRNTSRDGQGSVVVGASGGWRLRQFVARLRRHLVPRMECWSCFARADTGWWGDPYTGVMVDHCTRWGCPWHITAS
jgi:hypothetical protein